ncbi:hypothetical protein [Paraburkholderia sp. Ac-20342]|uniref:hypothetical protein n=1 Tax=Paraburkholderia sp. Ac-20342 TaxID=2703889 RepID=UPI00197D2658|nr:hypothetical protein [Paraburkholderia sp. Ac-20342]
MTFDVATYTSLWLITFLCCALITTALSRMFPQVVAFRFWAVGFYLNGASSACFALHLTWRHGVFLVLGATFALQCRILIWCGLRKLLGIRAPWRTGLALSLLFCALYGGALAYPLPILFRAALLALFFLPCRLGTLYDICRPRRTHLSPARSIAATGAMLASLNTILPLVLALLNRTNLSLVLANPRTTSALYAFVFAGDLLLASGLIVLAFKLLSVERNMLATLDRSASAHRAARRAMRALRQSTETLGAARVHHDDVGYAPTAAGTI